MGPEIPLRFVRILGKPTRVPILYGCNPKHPTEVVNTPPWPRTLVDLTEYNHNHSEGCRRHGSRLDSVSNRLISGVKERSYDWRAQDLNFIAGEWEFLNCPMLTSGPSYKLAKPSTCPYHISTLHDKELP